MTYNHSVLRTEQDEINKKVTVLCYFYRRFSFIKAFSKLFDVQEIQRFRFFKKMRIGIGNFIIIFAFLNHPNSAVMKIRISLFQPRKDEGWRTLHPHTWGNLNHGYFKAFDAWLSLMGVFFFFPTNLIKILSMKHSVNLHSFEIGCICMWMWWTALQILLKVLMCWYWRGCMCY